MSAACLGHGCWTSPEVDRQGEAVADWAAATLADRFGERSLAGLYVATSDSGLWEATAFWQASLDTGLRYASPKPFPWTLANSPTGRIAERLGIRGPTYTLIGGGEAMAAVVGHALDDIGSGVAGALVVALDGIGESTVALVAAELGPRVEGTVPVDRSDLDGWDDSEAATTALGRLVGRVGSP